MINKFTSHISRISPELNKLKEIAKETMEENIVHTIEVLESKEPLPKLIGRELGQMVVQGPSRIVEKVEKVSEPMRSIAEKTVEILAEEKSPRTQNNINIAIHKERSTLYSCQPICG